MRVASSRSSTSRAMCATWRSIMSRAWVSSGCCGPIIWKICTAFRIGPSGLRSSCASIAKNSFLCRSARWTSSCSSALSSATHAREHNASAIFSSGSPKGRPDAHIARPSTPSIRPRARTGSTAPRIRPPHSTVCGATSARASSSMSRTPSASSFGTCSKPMCSSTIACPGSAGRATSTRQPPPGTASVTHTTLTSAKNGTGRLARSCKVASKSSERPSTLPARARKPRPRLDSSAASRLLRSSASAIRCSASASCSSARRAIWWRIRNSSTKTRTFARRISGTTGVRM